MIADIVILIVLILCNGFFSMSEMAIVSSRRQRLQAAIGAKREAGDANTAGLELALKLNEEPSRFLSAVQVGITMIGVLAGAFGGATLSEPLANTLSSVPWLADYATQIAFAVVVILITYGSLIVGELVPKRIALANPEGIAAGIARPMSGFAKVLSPAVSFLGWSQDIVLKAAGLDAAPSVAVTPEEIKHLVEEGHQHGAIEGAERDIVHRVLELDETLVSELMTPRIRLNWLDISRPYEDNVAIIAQHRQMRYPVRNGPASEPVGMVRMEDFPFDDDGLARELFTNMTRPVYIPRTASTLRALSIMQSENVFMAFVIDEFGQVEGTVSLQEMFFAIVGDLSPHANPNHAIVPRDDGSYLIDGVVAAEEVRALLGLNRLPGDDSGEVTTLAGVMLARFNRLPKEGEYFAWNGYRFEVADMDGPRIDKVLIVPAPNLPIGQAMRHAASTAR